MRECWMRWFYRYILPDKSQSSIFTTKSFPYSGKEGGNYMVLPKYFRFLVCWLLILWWHYVEQCHCSIFVINVIIIEHFVKICDVCCHIEEALTTMVKDVALFRCSEYLCIADFTFCSPLKYEARFFRPSKIFTLRRMHRLLSTTTFSTLTLGRRPTNIVAFSKDTDCVFSITHPIPLDTELWKEGGWDLKTNCKS